MIDWRSTQFYPEYEKQLLNKYLEHKGNIRVFVRLRPILPIDFKAYDGTKESFEKIEKSMKVLNQNQIELTDMGAKASQNHLFCFDQVFGNQANQSDIFEEVQHLVQSFLDGHDVCIFSYGQTGSGKTYTMGTDASSLAQEKTKGIIPRSLSKIMSQIDNQETTVSF